MPGNYQRLRIGVNLFAAGHAHALMLLVLTAMAGTCHKVLTT